MTLRCYLDGCFQGIWLNLYLKYKENRVWLKKEGCFEIKIHQKDQTYKVRGAFEIRKRHIMSKKDKTNMKPKQHLLYISFLFRGLHLLLTQSKNSIHDSHHFSIQKIQCMPQLTQILISFGVNFQQLWLFLFDLVFDCFQFYG